MLNKLLLSALLLVATQAQAYDFPSLLQNHIVPVYRSLAERTTALDHAASGYCQPAPERGLPAVQAAYREAFLAWQGAQHLRFGPVQYLSREHRFAFWPDKRGTVRKHLARLRKDPELIGRNFDISSKSIAVQGFSALELMLFDENPPDPTGCRIITAITGNLQTMSNDLVQDWTAGEDAYGRFLVGPGVENPIFESDQELAGRLLNSLYTELELIVTQKLERPLGDGIDKARGRRAEGWRAGTSLSAVAANLAAAEDLYRQAFAAHLNASPLSEQISRRFEQAKATLLTIDKPLPEAVGDPVIRVRVEQLQAELSELKGLLGRDMATALGLSLGFNSLDGD